VRVRVRDAPSPQFGRNPIAALHVLPIHLLNPWPTRRNRDHQTSLPFDVGDEFFVCHASENIVSNLRNI
jgi:hypothetical protein